MKAQKQEPQPQKTSKKYPAKNTRQKIPGKKTLTPKNPKNPKQMVNRKTTDRLWMEYLKNKCPKIWQRWHENHKQEPPAKNTRQKIPSKKPLNPKNSKSQTLNGTAS